VNVHVTCLTRCVSSGAVRRWVAWKTWQRLDRCVSGRQAAACYHDRASTCRTLHSTAGPAVNQTPANYYNQSQQRNWWRGLTAICGGLDLRRYSTSGLVSTGMGDHLQVVKSSWYVASHPGRLSLLPCMV